MRSTPWAASPSNFARIFSISRAAGPSNGLAPSWTGCCCAATMRAKDGSLRDTCVLQCHRVRVARGAIGLAVAVGKTTLGYSGQHPPLVLCGKPLTRSCMRHTPIHRRKPVLLLRALGLGLLTMAGTARAAPITQLGISYAYYDPLSLVLKDQGVLQRKRLARTSPSTGFSVRAATRRWNSCAAIPSSLAKPQVPPPCLAARTRRQCRLLASPPPPNGPPLSSRPIHPSTAWPI